MSFFKNILLEVGKLFSSIKNVFFGAKPKVAVPAVQNLPDEKNPAFNRGIREVGVVTPEIKIVSVAQPRYRCPLSSSPQSSFLNLCGTSSDEDLEVEYDTDYDSEDDSDSHMPEKPSGRNCNSVPNYYATTPLIEPTEIKAAQSLSMKSLPSYKSCITRSGPTFFAHTDSLRPLKEGLMNTFGFGVTH